MKILRLCGVALFYLTACATANKFERTQVADGLHIESGADIYIYSFLDMREQEFGSDMLRNVHDQLSNALKSRGFDVQMFYYRDYLDSEDSFVSRISSIGHNSEIVPIKAIIEKNKTKEMEFGTDYRLIAFPNDFKIHGANQFFSIGWALTDNTSLKPLWSTEQGGGRTVWLKQDEMSDKRAADFISALISEMETSGLISRLVSAE